MTQVTRESHYVPQATLRRWSTDGTHVWAYRILVSDESVPEWNRHAISGLVRQRDVYATFDGDTEADAFERFITTEIEEPGQAAIETLIAGRRMHPADWKQIARFVAAQQMRTPLFLLELVQRLNEQLPQILSDVLREVENRGIEAASEQQRRRTHLDEHFRVTIVRPTGADMPATLNAEVRSSPQRRAVNDEASADESH